MKPTAFSYICDDNKTEKVKSMDINTTLIDGYLRMLENLSKSNKLDLIYKLTLTVETDTINRTKLFYKAFGALESKESADTIINEIRNSRTFNRKTEQF